MILSSAAPQPGLPTLLVAAALLLYALAAAPLPVKRLSAIALVGGWVLHAGLLFVDIAGVGLDHTGGAAGGARLGFAPVLSMTVWLVIGVHTLESRWVPLPSIRRGLAVAGLLAVTVTAVFPGEVRTVTSRLAPLHFALGVGAYGLFGAAVLHALLLDAAERRLRPGNASAQTANGTLGIPLLQLERVTFRFVEAGFVVLTATLLVGIATTVHWRWGDHKAVFSILAWCVFAALLVGRHLHGWRGKRATRWLYVGTALLLLAYVGSRFVLEVLLGRSAG